MLGPEKYIGSRVNIAIEDIPTCLPRLAIGAFTRIGAPFNYSRVSWMNQYPLCASITIIDTGLHFEDTFHPLRSGR